MKPFRLIIIIALALIYQKVYAQIEDKKIDSISDVCEAGFTSTFCFVPTVSALALDDWESKLTQNLGNVGALAGRSTRFSDCYAPKVSAYCFIVGFTI
jgi:hypothetical protein